jgi:hypothetical protein
MRGTKVKEAVSATLRMAAALAHLNRVTWSVFGFQDELIPVVGFGEGFGESAKRRIRAMTREADGDAPGGHNKPSWNDDGPCLREAAARLHARAERGRLLIVVSDGEPSGRRSNAADLKAAVAEVSALPGLKLWGLGLGAGTDHVTDFYPHAEACIAPENLAGVIERLLARSLHDLSRVH